MKYFNFNITTYVHIFSNVPIPKIIAEKRIIGSDLGLSVIELLG